MKIALFSYWDCNKQNNTSGFNSVQDMVVSTALSARLCNKNFDKTILCTTVKSKEKISSILHLFSEIILMDEQLKDVNSLFWGYAKMIAMKMTMEAYPNDLVLHIDNDVYLWDGITDDTNFDVFCQSIEDFTKYPQYFGYYEKLLKLHAEKWWYYTIPFFSFLKTVKPDICYNCGIIAVKDKAIFDIWFKKSTGYVVTGKDEFFEDEKNMLIHLNLFLEQYFLACVIKDIGLKVKCFIKEMSDCTKYPRFTHLWGTIKKDKKIMQKVYDNLKSLDNDLFIKITT